MFTEYVKIIFGNRLKCLVAITLLSTVSFVLQSDKLSDGSLKLKNILNQNVGSENIFFIETSGIVDATLKTLNSRQACSVESAALMNPSSNVYVLFVESDEVKASEIFNALLNYKNVFLVSLKLTEFSQNSPVESWMKEQKIIERNFSKEIFSDLLRLLVLWR